MRNLIVFFIFSSIRCQTWAKLDSHVEYKLSNWSKIVPEGLHEMPNNSEVCRVIYPSGAEVNLGNYLSRSDTCEAPPTITWTADPSSYYYMIFEDIDSPSRQRPTMRARFYWWVGNIPGNNVTAGETIFSYHSPQASHSSGLHRYLFLVYKQSEKNNYTWIKAKTTMIREAMNVREISSRFHSRGPVALNFFHFRAYSTDS